MTSRLVNVRLDAERLRKARRLREKGLALSDVVREAIDVRYDEVVVRGARDNPADVLGGILARFPDPPDMPARTYDVHDANAARRAIRERSRRRTE
jgi:hypothetical protein